MDLKCASCGNEIAVGVMFCPACGGRVSQGTPPGGDRLRVCTACGRQIEWDAKACMYCGRSMVDGRPSDAGGGKLWNTRTAGILIVAAGLLSVFSALVMVHSALDVFNFSSNYYYNQYTYDEEARVVLLISLTLMTAAVAATAGGLTAMFRRMYGLAVLGGVTATFGISYLFLLEWYGYPFNYTMSVLAGMISFPLGLIGLIMIANLKADFMRA